MRCTGESSSTDSPLGIRLADLAGRFVIANRAYQELVGYTNEELVQRSVAELTHEADRAQGAEIRRQLCSREVCQAKVEKREYRKDGSVIWVRATSSLVSGDDGAPLYLMSVIEDITDRKQAEERLRRSEAYLAEGQRISQTGSWAYKPATGELFWSREMYRIVGFDRNGGPPSFTDVTSRTHPDDLDGVRSTIRTAMAAHTGFEGEYRIVMPDSSVRFIHYRGRPIAAQDGGYEYVGTVMDVTDARMAEERLNASLREVHSLAGRLLRVQDEERRRLARELHETTAQDLAAVKMSLAALERLRPAPTEERQAVISEIGDLVQRALTDVRTTSYLLHPPLLDEAGLASALRWYVEGFTRRSGIRVDITQAEDLVRLPSEWETALFRVVQESLINIHRHANSPTASVRLRRVGDTLELEIEDKGRGMTDAHDVEPFGGGELGVGIAGMRERMQQLGGRLEILTAETGTTVRAILPLGTESS